MQIIRFIIILVARQRGLGGLAGCRRMGGQRPSALLCLRRPHFWPPKNGGKNRQPPSGWTPAFAQSDASKGDIQLPLNFCRAAGLLVIGVVLYELRLTALVLRCTSCGGKIDSSTPSKGRQPKPDEKPVVDQMPKESGSVATQYQIRYRPIGQNGVRGNPGGVLVTLPPRAK